MRLAKKCGSAYGTPACCQSPCGLLCKKLLHQQLLHDCCMPCATQLPSLLLFIVLSDPHMSKLTVVKYGINHITTLVEQRQASLVVIAHDVDPIELVVWLPALCRRMDVPYVIVKVGLRMACMHKCAEFCFVMCVIEICAAAGQAISWQCCCLCRDSLALESSYIWAQTHWRSCLARMNPFIRASELLWR